MSWVKEMLGAIDAPVEETNDVVDNAETSAEKPTEAPVDTPEQPTSEEPEQITSPTPEPEQVEPTEVKPSIDYKSWIEENKDAVSRYIQETSTDYTKLPAEDVLRKKIQEDNPAWSEEDVAAEMRDRYGVGLQKREIDEDNMTSDEIVEAKRHNEKVEELLSKGSRKMKADAKEAADYFNEKKSSLELPELNYELPKGVTRDEVLAEEIRVSQEYREKEVLPKFKEAVDNFESVQSQVEYEDNGNKVVIDLNYKLSETEKEELYQYLSGYIGHASDEQRYVVDGQIQFGKLVGDQAKDLLVDKLLKTVAKEAAAKARAEFVKNELVNHEDSPTTRTTPSIQSEAAEFISKVWGSPKSI